MPDQNPAADKQTRPFADFLSDHNRGAQHREAGETLQELVAAVVDTGKKGSITLTVNVEPMKNADENTLMTTVVVTKKLPVIPARGAVFYADDDMNLRREDPRQPTFDGLKDLGGSPDVKDAPAAPVVREA